MPARVWSLLCFSACNKVLAQHFCCTGEEAGSYKSLLSARSRARWPLSTWICCYCRRTPLPGTQTLQLKQALCPQPPHLTHEPGWHHLSQQSITLAHSRTTTQLMWDEQTPHTSVFLAPSPSLQHPTVLVTCSAPMFNKGHRETPISQTAPEGCRGKELDKRGRNKRFGIQAGNLGPRSPEPSFQFG